MKILGALVMGLLVVAFGYLAMCVALSADRRASIAMLASIVRVFVYYPLHFGVERCARWAGAWRPAAYQGRRSPLYRPTRLGRWLGLLHAALLDRLGREPCFTREYPRAAEVFLRNAVRVRRCLQGATWEQTDAHGFCDPEDLPFPELAIVEQDAEGIRVLRWFEPSDVEALGMAVSVCNANAVEALAATEDPAERAALARDVEVWRKLREALQTATDELEGEVDEAAGAVIISDVAWRGLARASDASVPGSQRARELADRIFENYRSQEAGKTSVPEAGHWVGDRWHPLTAGHWVERGGVPEVTMTEECYLRLEEGVQIVRTVARCPELPAALREQLRAFIASVDGPDDDDEGETPSGGLN